MIELIGTIVCICGYLFIIAIILFAHIVDKMETDRIIRNIKKRKRIIIINRSQNEMDKTG